jgi:hypothetical protein
MSRALLAGVCVAMVVSGCRKPAPPFAHRLEVRAVTGTTVQFIPAPEQLPYCLIYTQTDKGVTRQMTLTQSNQSVPCPAGEPVLGLRFRIPADEGLVHVRVLFSDQRLQAAEVAAQVVDMANPAFNPMDLRLPGRVVLDSVDFVPVEESVAVVGAMLKRAVSDAGSLSGPR